MLHAREIYVNITKGHRFGESGKYETWTDNRAKLFRSYQQEFGKCVSKMYRDTKTGTKTIGWVFQKTMQYQDSRDTYIREVWVEIIKE